MDKILITYDDSKKFNSNEFLKLNDNDKLRIKKLRIPPNWKNVKISKDPSDKIQVIGVDNKGRKQYIYHPAWTNFSKELKFDKCDKLDFNKFENVIEKYSKIIYPEFNKNYVICNMLKIMKDLNIRVGNEIYLDENKSVGLTTMGKKNFYKDSKGENYLYFKGKKGVEHKKKLKKNHKNFIEKIIKIDESKDNFLFKYLENNSLKHVNSKDMNNFLRNYVDRRMTTKDVRTYSANKIFLKNFNELKFKYGDLGEKGIKKAKIEAIRITANELGNTEKVCRDSYINPNYL